MPETDVSADAITAAIRAQAAEVATLYPAVYRRFHVSHQHVVGAEVTPRMLGALQHLAVAGPLTLSELVQHLGLGKATVTELMDRLAAKDLVARMPDDRDRRRVFIWLTDAGRTLATQQPRILEDNHLARALGRMRPTDRDQLIHGLRALLAAEEEVRHE